MILLNLSLLFGFDVPRGAMEAKRREGIYGEPPLLGIPRRYVVSIVARVGVWNTEELYPLNRDSSLCVHIFASAFFLLALWFRLFACSRL